MMPSKDTANSHTKQHQWAGNKLGRAAVEITCIGYNSTAVIEQHIQLLHILYMSQFQTVHVGVTSQHIARLCRHRSVLRHYASLKYINTKQEGQHGGGGGGGGGRSHHLLHMSWYRLTQYCKNLLE